MRSVACPRLSAAMCGFVQEESILRGVGYERSQLPQFLEEVAMTEEDWQRWVQQEVTQTVERLCTRQMDSRSPQDVFEEFLAGQRTVRPWYGVATDKRAIVESHPYGPLSDKQALPAHVTVRSLACPATSSWWHGCCCSEAPCGCASATLRCTRFGSHEHQVLISI